MPVLFDNLGAMPQRDDGFASGARSISVPVEEDRWLKPKGAGIHTGGFKPKLRGGRIYTYYLSQAMIGDSQLTWGLSSLSTREGG